MLFGYSRLLVLPLGVHAEISLRPRQLLCFCQWSGKILASFLSLPLAVMCSRISPRVNSLLFMSITPNVIRVFSFTGSTSQRDTLRFPCVPAICCVFASGLAIFSPSFSLPLAVLLSRFRPRDFLAFKP